MNIFGTNEAFGNEAIRRAELSTGLFGATSATGDAGVYGRGNPVLQPAVALGTAEEQLAAALNVRWKPNFSAVSPVLVGQYYKDYLAQRVARDKQKPLGQAYPSNFQPVRPTV